MAVPDTAFAELESSAPGELRGLVRQIGRTPVETVRLSAGGADFDVWLKLESANPAGSSKDRTALALVTDLERRGLLDKRSRIVESTSGNLGVALAFICRAKGYHFTAVVDPKAP